VHWLIKNPETNVTKAYEKEVPNSMRSELNYKLIGESLNGRKNDVVASFSYRKSDNDYTSLGWYVKCKNELNEVCQDILFDYKHNNREKIKQLVIKTINSSPYKSR
jgi:hypothetical protein